MHKQSVNRVLLGNERGQLCTPAKERKTANYSTLFLHNSKCCIVLKHQFRFVWKVNKLSDLWHTDVPWVNAPDWSHPSCKQPFVGLPSVSSRKWPTKINKMEWSINRFIASEIDKNEMERPEMTGCLIVELVLDFSWLLRTSCYPHFPISTKVRNKATKTTVQQIWLIKPSETEVCMPRTNFGTKNIVLS